MKNKIPLPFQITCIYLFIIFLVFPFLKCSNHSSNSIKYSIGNKIDSINGVYVYYNESFDNISGRNKTPDGYNLGLKYQCVEFVKRYYYEFYKHKMPNSWGHAKNFFENGISDGELNKDRNLKQYSNPSKSKPRIGDIVVFDKTIFNSFGHVAIIADVRDQKIEIIQQNVGKKTRESYSLKKENNYWMIDNNRILGWLRLK